MGWYRLWLKYPGFRVLGKKGNEMTTGLCKAFGDRSLYSSPRFLVHLVYRLHEIDSEMVLLLLETHA